MAQALKATVVTAALVACTATQPAAPIETRPPEATSSSATARPSLQASSPRPPASQGARSPGAVIEADSYAEDFDDGWADDWELPSGFVVQDKALSATGPGAARYRFGDYWQNAKLSLRLKHITGELRIHYRVDWSRFDAVTPIAGYEIAFGTAELTLSRFERSGGDRRDDRLARAPLPQLRDAWREILVIGSDRQLRISVDGREVIAIDDPAPIRQGSVGVDVKSGGRAIIDDVRVTAETVTEQTWTRMSGPVGTQPTSIVVDPSDPARLYAGTFHSGLFVSTDRGRRWEQVGSVGGITKTKVGSIEIAPSATNVIYLSHLEGGGASRSDDRGAHWFRIRPGDFGQVNALAAHPQESEIVYAGIGTADTIHSPAEDGVYMSRDRGVTWRQVLRERAIFDLKVAKARPSTMYAAGPFGVMRSDDAGVTWVEARSGLGERSIAKLLLEPGDPLVAYAREGMGPRRVFRTTDAGKSWQEILRGAEAIAMSGTGTVVFAVEAGRLLRSEDRGQTWARVSSEQITKEAVPALAVDPSDARRLYAAVRGQGVFTSGNGGLAWEGAATHFRGDFSAAVATHPRRDGTVYVGHGDGRLSVTTDGGGTWQELTRIARGGDEQVTSIAVAAGEREMLFASNRRGVHRSSDGGTTWELTNVGLADSRIIFVAVDPTDPRRVFAGTGTNRPYGIYQGSGLYRSTDGGDSWSPAVGIPLMPVPSVAFSASQPSVAYAAVLGGGVFRSTNGGATWAPTDGPLEDRQRRGNPWVYAIAVDPMDPNIVYAGTQRYYGDPGFQTFGAPRSAQDGLWRSADGGRTWQLLWNDVWVENILVDPLRPGHVYFSEHSERIWHSSDGGASWDLATRGLVAWSAHLYPYGMAFDRSGSAIYMVNCGMGMYRNLVKAPEGVK